jgi:hypothetical protein
MCLDVTSMIVQTVFSDVWYWVSVLKVNMVIFWFMLVI